MNRPIRAGREKVHVIPSFVTARRSGRRASAGARGALLLVWTGTVEAVAPDASRRVGVPAATETAIRATPTVPAARLIEDRRTGFGRPSYRRCSQSDGYPLSGALFSCPARESTERSSTAAWSRSRQRDCRRLRLLETRPRSRSRRCQRRRCLSRPKTVLGSPGL